MKEIKLLVLCMGNEHRLQNIDWVQHYILSTQTVAGI